MDVMRIDAGRIRLSRGSKIQRAQVGRLELDCYGTVLSLELQQRSDQLGRVGSERGRGRAQLELFQIALENHFLTTKEDLAIGGLRLQRRVVQRKQQRVIERYPAEAVASNRAPSRPGS